MHTFTELIDRCTTFTLSTLGEANEKTIEALETSAATSLVKTLQMIQLQKTILAVGMFSIFEASLQENLGGSYGFREAQRILDNEGKLALKEQFDNFYLAINVLKHGRGDSYDALISKTTVLPFKIKLPNESFFVEGDVSEISTLVEVDDAFVQHCADVIKDVSDAIRSVYPEFL